MKYIKEAIANKLREVEAEERNLLSRKKQLEENITRTNQSLKEVQEEKKQLTDFLHENITNKMTPAEAAQLMLKGLKNSGYPVM